MCKREQQCHQWDVCPANLVCAAISEILRQSGHYLVSLYIQLDSAAWKRNTNCPFFESHSVFFQPSRFSREAPIRSCLGNKIDLTLHPLTVFSRFAHLSILMVSFLSVCPSAAVETWLPLNPHWVNKTHQSACQGYNQHEKLVFAYCTSYPATRDDRCLHKPWSFVSG